MKKKRSKDCYCFILVWLTIRNAGVVRKKQLLQFTELGTSFTSKMNNTLPNVDPWGTPKLFLCVSVWPWRETHRCQQKRVWLVNKHDPGFHNSLIWSTEFCSLRYQKPFSNLYYCSAKVVFRVFEWKSNYIKDSMGHGDILF